MKKKTLLILLVIGVFFATAFALSRSYSKGNGSSMTLWHQFTRRLFDDDVPREKKKTTKQFDMTNI